jgi:hypothetical protein
MIEFARRLGQRERTIPLENPPSVTAALTWPQREDDVLMEARWRCMCQDLLKIANLSRQHLVER